MRWWWASAGIVVGVGACSFPWDDLDPRLGQGGATTGAAAGGSATGGDGGQGATPTAAGGSGGTGGDEPDPCRRCPTTCSDAFSESFAAPPADWTFNGSAAHDATSATAVLTPAMTGQAGTVFRNTPLTIDVFTASFEVMISQSPMSTGGAPPAYGAGDGVAFVLQTEGPTALVNIGGSFGVSPLSGFAIELDTFSNTVTCLEPDFEHVALDDLSTCDLDGPDSIPTTIAASDALPSALAEGGWRSVTVDFDNGMVSVSLDGNAVLGPVALPGFVAGGAYYLGFGAGTGGAYNRHEVRNLTVTLPGPRCL